MHTYHDQIQNHITFLRTHRLDVTSLNFDSIMRCRSIGQNTGRSDLACRSWLNWLENGCVGIVSWCRGYGGAKHTLKTYGLGPNAHFEKQIISTPDPSKEHEEASRRCFGFWQHSSLSGLSDYLIT